MSKAKIRPVEGRPRLEADAVLTPDDFACIADQLGQRPIRARKIGYVAARRATTPETIETHADGKETTNIARPGDYVVTNLSPQRRPLIDCDRCLNVYVITAKKFADLYEATPEANKFGEIYRAKGFVSALALSGGFDILAPWGERQTGASGYLLLNGDEVYGSSTAAFKRTYREVRSTGEQRV